MRISFHYTVPSAANATASLTDRFSTPIKVKTLYGSRETAESSIEQANSRAHRIHRLRPSLSPLTSSKAVCSRNPSLSPPPASIPRITFTYLLNLGRDNIQSEIEELKTVLRGLAHQEHALEEEKERNREQYEQLLGALDEECAVMATKAAGLHSAIVQLQIEITEESE